MPECIHFPDDPNAVCSICHKKKGFDAWQTEDYGDAVEARYHGTCARCKATIYPGDLIRQVDGEWEHKDCRA